MGLEQLQKEGLWPLSQCSLCYRSRQLGVPILVLQEGGLHHPLVVRGVLAARLGRNHRRLHLREALTVYP